MISTRSSTIVETTSGGRRPGLAGDQRHSPSSFVRKNSVSSLGGYHRPRLCSGGCDYCQRRPCIRCCRDHSAGRSVRQATPIPCGSRPSMAAWTRSGARKASEMVMLIFRTLQFSRVAMLSALPESVLAIALGITQGLVC